MRGRHNILFPTCYFHLQWQQKALLTNGVIIAIMKVSCCLKGKPVWNNKSDFQRPVLRCPPLHWHSPLDLSALTTFCLCVAQREEKMTKKTRGDGEGEAVTTQKRSKKNTKNCAPFGLRHSYLSARGCDRNHTEQHRPSTCPLISCYINRPKGRF